MADTWPPCQLDVGEARGPMIASVLGYGEASGGVPRVASATINLMVFTRRSKVDSGDWQRDLSSG